MKTVSLCETEFFISSVFERTGITNESGYDLGVLPKDEAYPGILHQQHAVILAQRVFGITDPAVLSSIGCHTTLKVGASPLDKLIFAEKPPATSLQQSGTQA